MPTLKWHMQKQVTTSKIETQCKALLLLPTTIIQKFKIIIIVIHPRVAYAFYTTPFPKPNIIRLDKILIQLTISVCRIPNSSLNILTQLPHVNFGMNTTSLLLEYITCMHVWKLN